jgi:hypothetical protein
LRVFLSRQVSKLVRSERLPAGALCQAAREVVGGRFGGGEAFLGGDLFKKRVAREGGGKSGGFRFIIAYRAPKVQRVLFVHAFAKNEASTLTPKGHSALAKVARAFVRTDDEQIQELLAAREFREISCDGD